MNLFKFLMSILPLLTMMPVLACAQQAVGSIPDITGVWERARDPASPLMQQAQLRPEYLKEKQRLAQAQSEANAKGAPLATRLMQCQGDGMPGMMGGPFPMEILQSKGQVTIIQEAYTQVRRIYLDQAQQAAAEVEPSFFGHSVGRWEQGMLLIDTIGIKPEVMYQNIPHSEQMRIKEKIYFITNEILRDEITVEDPVVLEKPWTFTMSYKRMSNYQMLEYICEGNRYYVDENGQQKMLPSSILK